MGFNSGFKGLTKEDIHVMGRKILS
jgi:hypothetical protein